MNAFVVRTPGPQQELGLTTVKHCTCEVKDDYNKVVHELWAIYGVFEAPLFPSHFCESICTCLFWVGQPFSRLIASRRTPVRVLVGLRRARKRDDDHD